MSVLTAAALLREDGRGRRVNLVELQAGEVGRAFRLGAGRALDWLHRLRTMALAVPRGAGEEQS